MASSMTTLSLMAEYCQWLQWSFDAVDCQSSPASIL